MAPPDPTEPQFRIRVNAGDREIITEPFEGPVQLSIVLADGVGEPLAGYQYEITGIPDTITGTTGDDGAVDQMLPKGTTSCTIKYWQAPNEEQAETLEIELGDETDLDDDEDESEE